MKIGPFVLKLIFRFIKKNDERRKKEWPNVDLYEHRLDIDALGDGNYFHQIDIYYAPKDKANGKTVIDVHGGAYIYGDRKNNFGFATVFLEQGFNVVMLDYEPNNGARDCRGQVAALAGELAYLQTHAEELGIDPKELYLVGDSAGGHYATLLAEMAANEELSLQNGPSLHGISFKALAVCCPVYDFRRNVHNASVSRKGKIHMFGPCFAEDSFIDALDPRLHRADLNLPIIITTCYHDFLKQESFDFRDDLQKEGKPHQWVYIENRDSKVSHVHNVMDIGFDDSKKVNQAIIDFFLVA